MPAPTIANKAITEAQQEAYDAVQKHGTIRAAARALGKGYSNVHRQYNLYMRKMELDPAIADSMTAVGTGLIPALTWAKTKNPDGTSYSVLLKPQQDDAESIRDVIEDALLDLGRMPVIDAPARVETDINNIIPIADLHFGGEYGRASYETECCDTMDRLFGSLARGQRATIIDLGDTTDANDHLGVTPASKNPCDVIRHGMLGTIWTALRFLKHVTYRALETHQEVEVHVLRGNHSETSYIGVLLALMEHFADNPRVTIVIPPAEGPESMFRIIQWGECGILADHGDKMKWPVLRDIWTTAFAESWTASRAYRGIYTAHFHSDRQQDLAGVEGRQFRTMSAPSNWAKERFPPMPRSASAISLHKWEGFDGMIQKKLRPVT